MKNILLLLSFISLVCFSQADIEILDLDVKNTTNTDDYFYYIDLNAGVDTTLYLITGEYLMPWTYSSSYGGTINTRNAARVSIGGSGDLNYAFKTYGSGYFTQNIRATRAYLGPTNYVTSSGNDLIFYDATNGSKTLSQLLTSSASYTYSNGVTLSGTSVKLGGSLSENTTVLTGNYILKLGGTTTNYFNLSSNGYYGYFGSSTINSTGNLTLACSNGFSLAYTSTTDANIFRDYTGDNNGLQYYTDYSDDIKADSSVRSLIDYGFLIDFLQDSSYLNMNDTVSDIATKYDIDTVVNMEDTISVIATKNDLLAYNTGLVYCDSVDITSSNILNGDNITIVPAKGANTIICPVSFMILGSTGTEYTGGGSNYFEMDATQLLVITSETLGLDVPLKTYFNMGQITFASGGSDFSNDPLSFNFATHADGNKTMKIYVWYTIIYSDTY